MKKGMKAHYFKDENDALEWAKDFGEKNINHIMIV